jgi:hypothetical protein
MKSVEQVKVYWNCLSVEPNDRQSCFLIASKLLEHREDQNAQLNPLKPYYNHCQNFYRINIDALDAYTMVLLKILCKFDRIVMCGITKSHANNATIR